MDTDSGFTPMPETQWVAFYACLFALAGADGDIGKEELLSIFETLDTDGRSESARQQIGYFHLDPPPFEENLEVIAGGPEELHYGFLVALMEVALVDGDLRPEEQELLQRASTRLSISQAQVAAIEKCVRDLQRVRARGIDDNLAVEGLKAATAGLAAVGVPLTAVYFSGSVVGFSAAGITSGLAALGLGLGVVPGIGVAILLGTAVCWTVSQLLDWGNHRAKAQLQAEGERRARLAIANLQTAIDQISARLRDWQTYSSDLLQIIGGSAAGITFGLVTLGSGMMPDLGIVLLIGTGMFLGGSWFVGCGSRRKQKHLLAERERRARLAIGNLQAAVDEITARVRTSWRPMPGAAVMPMPSACWTRSRDTPPICASRSARSTS
jgi:hypothetical protein